MEAGMNAERHKVLDYGPVMRYSYLELVTRKNAGEGFGGNFFRGKY